MTDRQSLRGELEDLYYEYAAAVDDDLERWPEFFFPDAVYRVVARENFERGLALATILAEGHGMLLDRVTAIRETMMYKPRTYRHIVSNVRVLGTDSRGTRASANFALYESTPFTVTGLLAVGRFIDLVGYDDRGSLRFKEKTCVYDGDVLQSSLVYPL